MSGRPLRFLGVTLGGWVAVRVALLWPSINGVPDLIRAVAPPLAAAERPPVRAAARPVPVRPRPPGARARFVAGREAGTGAHRRAGDPEALALAVAALTRFGRSVPERGVIPPPLRPLPLAKGASRWSGSAWLLARGGAAGTLSGGRLGASQAGVRIGYALGEGRRVAIVGRLATPLSGRGREAAIGVEWAPARLPVRVIAEQRFALDGGSGGPTAMLVAGLAPTAIAAGFRLEAYGQAGAVVRDGVEGFADGAARLTRPVAAIGRMRVDMGLGSWGAVQRDAARVDIGPTIGVAIPAGGTTLRLAADWRQRIAGDARPGSGPALSIGADF